MLAHIINSPDLTKYIISFSRGQTIFLEGDPSQDLYALVSGKLDIFKGNHKIAEVSEEGAIFGEMSFLLERNRTATVKAATDAKVIRIPREEVPPFLKKFPEVVKAFAKTLAKRLDATSRLAFGLKEFCNQLPDAVILADKEGKILSLNAAAERLYGKGSNRMIYRSAEEIYENPVEYKTFINKVISKNSVRERTLRIKHPRKGVRYISTSTTVLYDAQHHFQGVLSLGRDVTQTRKLEKRYRRVRKWFIPIVALMLFASVGIFLGYPYLYREKAVMNSQRIKLRDELAVDYRLLSSMLVDAFQSREKRKTHEILKRFFNVKGDVTMPYTGVVLLDDDKRAFDAYRMLSERDTETIVGSSYTGIGFHGNKESPHKVLTVYREHKEVPMGQKGIEVAFEMVEDGNHLGWLIFQLNTERLEDTYHVDVETLKAFRFKDFSVHRQENDD